MPIFSELIAKYNSWNKLAKFLESVDGGLLRIIPDINGNTGHVIIRYEKGVSDMTLKHTRWFRSVVWDTIANRPLSIAPPKANDVAVEDTYIGNNNCVVESYLDGFMINCYRSDNDTIHIASRSLFGATGKVDTTHKTLNDLFYEAIKSDNTLDTVTPDEYLKEQMKAANFCSFHVQHPEYRIVSRIVKPRAIMIHKGLIDIDSNINIEDTTKVLQIEAGTSALNENSTFKDWVREYINAAGWGCRGIIIKDDRGNRWRVCSESYKLVKSLRGNFTHHINNFARLREQNSLHRFLEYYPEYRANVREFESRINVLVLTIYTFYKHIHVLHISTIDAIDRIYWPHLYTIHSIYLAKHKPNGSVITEDDVFEYVQKLPWQRVIFLLNKITTFGHAE